MKNLIVTSVILMFLLCGCSRHLINYEIKNLSEKINKPCAIAIETFQDQRPQEEREGHAGEFLAFASKDDDFASPPSNSITELFREELQSAGFNVAGETTDADYLITGEVLHFQAMVKLPTTTIIPYLGTVASLWESDEFTIAVTIRARMEDIARRGILFEREFNISENLRLKTGLLNLERWFGRGMGYQFKLLNLALADVLGQMRDEVIKTAGDKG